MDPTFKISDKLYTGLRKQSMAQGLIKSFEGSGQVASLEALTGDVLVRDPKGSTTRFSFDAQGFIGAVTSPLGRRWTLENDSSGRMLGLTDPGAFRIGMEYGAQGDVKSVSSGRRPPTELSFDDYHRLTQIAYPDKTTRQIRYDERGHATGVTDRLRSEESYEYDPDGELVAITDGNGNRTRFDYGLWKRPDRVNYADGSSESYAYDPAGFLRRISTGDEAVVDIEYDNSNLLAKLVYRDGETITFKYNDQGKIVEAGCGDYVVKYAYNDAGQVVREDQNGQVVEYHYDEANSLIGLTYPTSETVAFDYDADLRLSSVRDWQGGLHAFNYGKDDRSSTLRSPNGCLTTFLQSETGRPQATIVSRETLSGREEIYSFRCEYDAEERVAFTKDSGFGLRAYTYDSEGQLLGVKADRPGMDETFDYDRAGNRTHCNGETATFNALNQLTSQGASRCTYDDRGNLVALTTPNASWRYSYNSRNLLIRAEDNRGTSVSFGYDAFGRRIWKRSGRVETRYLWAGEQVVSEVVVGGAEELRRDYLYYPGTYSPLALRLNGKVFSYYNDHLGTPRRLLDEQGKVVWSADYRAFGQAEVANNTIRNFLRLPGQCYDEETGLHYNRFRYYAPTFGRYLSRDAVTFLSGLNFYSYSGSNPLNDADPLGLSIWTTLGVIAVSVAVGAAVVALAPVALPLAIVAAGAAAGAVGFGLNEVLENGFCPSCILKAMGRGALIGAASALPFAFLPVAAGYAATMGAGGLGGALGYIADFSTNSSHQWNWGDFAIAVGVGVVTAGIGKYLGTKYAELRGAKQKNLTKQQLSNWYKKQGLVDPKKLDSHLAGTDFNSPVKTKPFSKGDELIQYVRKDGTPGMYFAEPGTPMEKIGITGQREMRRFIVVENIEGIESTASSLPENFAPGVGGSGGAQQYILPKGWEKSIKQIP